METVAVKKDGERQNGEGGEEEVTGGAWRHDQRTLEVHPSGGASQRRPRPSPPAARAAAATIVTPTKRSSPTSTVTASRSLAEQQRTRERWTSERISFLGTVTRKCWSNTTFLMVGLPSLTSYAYMMARASSSLCPHRDVPEAVVQQISESAGHLGLYARYVSLLPSLTYDLVLCSLPKCILNRCILTLYTL